MPKTQSSRWLAVVRHFLVNASMYQSTGHSRSERGESPNIVTMGMALMNNSAPLKKRSISCNSAGSFPSSDSISAIRAGGHGGNNLCLLGVVVWDTLRRNSGQSIVQSDFLFKRLIIAVRSISGPVVGL